MPDATPEDMATVTSEAKHIVTATVAPPKLDYQSLAAAADHMVEGYDLTREKSVLLGVPFAITGIIYRDGTPRSVMVDKKKSHMPTNYLSIEVVVADAELLKRRVKRGMIRELNVDPNETIIFNDGSTGIARQLTEWLHLQGHINVGPYEETGGAAGESPFDRYRKDWVSGAEQAEEGFKGYPLLLCPRGLRVSEYTPEGLKEGSETFYLA